MGLMNNWMYGHPEPETLPIEDRRRINYTSAQIKEDPNINIEDSKSAPFNYKGYVIWNRKMFLPGFDPEVEKKKQIILKEQEKIEREKIRKRVRSEEENANGFKGIKRVSISNDDAKIRPRNFASYFGQKHAVELVRQMIEACKKQKGCLKNLLLFGAPGIGKTALISVIAHELTTDVLYVNAKALKDLSSVLNMFSKIRQVSEGQGTIIQMDEIDLMDIEISKMLHRALEENRIEFQNQNGEWKLINLPQFTLIGTSNNLGKIDSAFRSRCYEIPFSDYSAEEIALILQGVSRKLDLPIDAPAKKNLAKRSRGNPRQSILNFQLVRDIAITTDKTKATLKEVEHAMELLGIDENGYSRLDLKVIKYLRNIPGQRASERALADHCELDIKTYREKIECYLKKTGMILVGGRGRTLTKTGLSYEIKGEKYDK